MTTKLLRSATLSLGAAAGAVLAVAFLPRGVAAAGPEDELYWFPDFNSFNETSNSDLFLVDTETGTGPLNGYATPFETTLTPVLPDELQANTTITDVPLLDSASVTSDITGGDAAIPTGSVIDLSSNPDFAAETVEVPGAGLFGLPEITETFFTPFGDFSF